MGEFYRNCSGDIYCIVDTPYNAEVNKCWIQYLRLGENTTLIRSPDSFFEEVLTNGIMTPRFERVVPTRYRTEIREDGSEREIPIEFHLESEVKPTSRVRNNNDLSH